MLIGDMEQLVARIRRLRKEAGHGLKETKPRGKSVSWLSRVEKGEIRDIRLADLFEIAANLGVSLAALSGAAEMSELEETKVPVGADSNRRRGRGGAGPEGGVVGTMGPGVERIEDDALRRARVYFETRPDLATRLARIRERNSEEVYNNFLLALFGAWESNLNMALTTFELNCDEHNREE